MNSRTKRILSLVLTLCMLLSTFPVTALGLDTIPAQAQSQSTEVSKGSEIPGTGYHVTSMKNYSGAGETGRRSPGPYTGQRPGAGAPGRPGR